MLVVLVLVLVDDVIVAVVWILRLNEGQRIIIICTPMCVGDNNIVHKQIKMIGRIDLIF